MHQRASQTGLLLQHNHQRGSQTNPQPQPNRQRVNQTNLRLRPSRQRVSQAADLRLRPNHQPVSQAADLQLRRSHHRASQVQWEHRAPGAAEDIVEAGVPGAAAVPGEEEAGDDNSDLLIKRHVRSAHFSYADIFTVSFFK